MIPAIQSGIDARDYWTLTLGEIMATIEAYNRNLNFQIELSKQTTYTQAVLISQFVWILYGGKQPLPAYEDCFSVSGAYEDKLREEKVNIYEQQWKAFAIEHNRRRQKKIGG